MKLLKSLFAVSLATTLSLSAVAETAAPLTQAKDSMMNSVSETKAAAKTMMTDTVSDMKSGVMNKAASAKSDATQAVQSVKNVAKEKATKMKSDAMAQANHTQNGLSEKMSTTKAKTEKTMASAQKATVEKANDAKVKAKNAVNSAKNTATEKAGVAKSAIGRTGKININKADAKTLQNLTGIGETKAQAIIDYRAKHGKIKNLTELSKVSGIGEATLEKIKSSISF